MEQPSRRTPTPGRRAGRTDHRPSWRPGSAGFRLPVVAGVGLPVALVVGGLIVFTGVGAQAGANPDTVTPLAASGTTAANGTGTDPAATSPAATGPTADPAAAGAVASGTTPPGTTPSGATPSGATTPGTATADAAAGTAPVVQRQTGLMLDPRGKRRAARAARQAAAQAKAQAAANANQAAVPNPNCTVIVPADPTTAAGLATPFQLVATDPAAGPCNEANINQSAFVQGAIISPAGQVTLYDPLIVDQGTQPVAQPAAANVPAGSTVALWFGFNGDQLTLRSAAGTNALQQGNCVNGLQGSIFGQFAACNAPAFFQAATAAVQNNQLQVPALGTAKDGLPCPTVRDFSVVDQDESDNVTTHELAGANGATGQNNAAARAALQQLGQNPVDLANGSDNRLLDVFILPTLGCQPWTAANGAADGQATPSLPLNELQAAAGQAAPVALVPLTDPMVLNNNNQSAEKTNLYRAQVGQPPLGQDNGNGTTYCQNLFGNAAGIQRVFKDTALFSGGPSPDPAAANNLFTFLAMRAQQSFENLNCGQLLGQANPITLTVANNVVTAATFTPGGAAAGAGAGAGAGTGNGATTPTTPGVTPTTPGATGGTGVTAPGTGAGMTTGTGTTPTTTTTASPTTTAPRPHRRHRGFFPTAPTVPPAA